MSKVSILHSHSALERELRFPKHVVLVDLQFADMFDSKKTKEFTTLIGSADKTYLRVPILDFVKLGGIFKNFSS